MAIGLGEGFDTALRMVQVQGKPQRVAPVDMADLSDEASELADTLLSSFGLNSQSEMAEVLRVMLRHPTLFDAQLRIVIALAGKGTIPPRDRELAILRNAWLAGAPYEWGEHVDVAKRFGITPDEIERCTQGSAADGWSRHDRAVIAGVEELHRDVMLSDETWDILAESWNELQLMEFPVLVGQYLATAMQQNSLRIRLAEDNPGLSHR